MGNIRQETLAHAKKILIKVGSAVLTGAEGLDLKIIDSLVAEMSELVHQDFSVVLVTSGAVASGKHRLNITGKLKSMPEKQAAAAVGQGRLMRVYSKSFEKNGLFVAHLEYQLRNLIRPDELLDNRLFSLGDGHAARGLESL